MIEIRNAKRFSINIDKIARKLELNTALVVKKVAIDIFAELVANTPVDTGRAMNNWNISVGSVDRSVSEAGGSPAGIESSKKSFALGELSSYQIGDVVWISNSLDYIVFLNEGSSEQAPRQFVERAIINTMNSIAVNF